MQVNVISDWNCESLWSNYGAYVKEKAQKGFRQGQSYSAEHIFHSFEFQCDYSVVCFSLRWLTTSVSLSVHCSNVQSGNDDKARVSELEKLSVVGNVQRILYERIKMLKAKCKGFQLMGIIIREAWSAVCCQGGKQRVMKWLVNDFNWASDSCCQLTITFHVAEIQEQFKRKPLQSNKHFEAS